MSLRWMCVLCLVVGAVRAGWAQECKGAPSYTTAQLESRDAAECNLAQMPACQRIRPAYEEAIFVGRVVAIRDLDGHMVLDGECTKTSVQSVTVRVGEVFKGSERNDVTIHAGDLNGFYFQPRKAYLIFAKPERDGTLRVTSCGGSKEIHEAAQDIAYLRSWASRPLGGAIFGSAWKPVSAKDLARMVPRAMPIAKLNVSIDGPKRLTVTTGADGGYRAEGLAPGQYEVSIDVPFATWPDRKQKVEVVERGCALVNFHVNPFEPAQAGGTK